jgi:hypothetical protein
MRINPNGETAYRLAADRQAAERDDAEREVAQSQDAEGETADRDNPNCQTADGETTHRDVADRDHASRNSRYLTARDIWTNCDREDRNTPERRFGLVAHSMLSESLLNATLHAGSTRVTNAIAEFRLDLWPLNTAQASFVLVYIALLDSRTLSHAAFSARRLGCYRSKVIYSRRGSRKCFLLLARVNEAGDRQQQQRYCHDHRKMG